MRNYSMMWARFLGLYTIVLGFWVLLYGDQITLILMSIGNNPAMMMIFGVFILLMGLAMIVSHNIWHGWPILITVIGYLITIKGVAFLFFPHFSVHSFLIGGKIIYSFRQIPYVYLGHCTALFRIF